MKQVQLWHQATGSGPPVVLIHAGICDARMWERQMTTLAADRRVVRCDLRGFGRTSRPPDSYSDAADVIELLESQGAGAVVLVGASMGGGVALDATLARPDLVAGLVLVGASHPEQQWSAEIEAYDEREDVLLEVGDVDAAVELNLRVWVDGPRRAPEDVSPELRASVGEMQRRAFELQLAHPDVDAGQLVPDPGQRLGEIAVPTLVLVGDLDVPEMIESAARLAAEIPGARAETIAGASHLPSLERPDRFEELVLGFLTGIDG